MKRVIGLSLFAILGALIFGHRWATKKARNVFPMNGEWFEVETQDEPEEFGDSGGYPEIFPFGIRGRS